MVVVVNADWVKEVEQTIQRAFDDNHSTDIATLELNTLKMAMNITFKDLRQVVIPAILTLISSNASADAVYHVHTIDIDHLEVVSHHQALYTFGGRSSRLLECDSSTFVESTCYNSEDTIHY
jgi:hypothetical protein